MSHARINLYSLIYLHFDTTQIQQENAFANPTFKKVKIETLLGLMPNPLHFTVNILFCHISLYI
jgi:hypothetical protein